MPKYVALLRGVNVGKAKRVPMAELRDLLTELGATDVRTLLNSGNAVFQSTARSAAKLAADVATAIASRFGFEVPVIVQSAADLDAIVAECPIAVEEAHFSRFLVAFVQDAKALQGLSAIAPLVAPPERFAIGRRAAYLHCAGGILESKAGEALLGRLGRAATTRNWATVLKLQALAS